MANVSVRVDDYHLEVEQRLMEAANGARDDSRDLLIAAIESHVPHRTGKLAGSIRELERVGTTVYVGTTVWYANLIEFGTSRHYIHPERRKALFWSGDDHPVALSHPRGIREHPFMRTGYEQSRNQIVDLVAARMQAAVES